MKTVIKNLFMAAVLLTAAISSSRAQTSVGFLDFNPDPVSLSMAGIGVTLEATPYAMWNNAAAAALDEGKFRIGAAYSLWQPSTTANDIVAVAGYGRIADFITISAGLKYFGHSPYEITDGSTGMVTGRFTPVELQAGIGLGFRILPILSLGANIHYVHSDIGGLKKGSAVSADFGALVDLRFMRIGVTVSNIGSRISYGGLSSYGLPANVKLGLGTVRHFGDEHRHAFSANLEGGMTLVSSSFFAGIGVLYAWNNLVRVAAGYHYGDTGKQFVGSYASLGVGVSFIGISLDAAYLIATDGSPVGNTFSLGLGYAF